ncbi:hypothetical protein [Streptomyces decoyicus]|uniref:hypothetical protein n=1 Tax=Streptomyces decoyicus TaxID=249567 RepID=UPI0037FBAF57
MLVLRPAAAECHPRAILFVPGTFGWVRENASRLPMTSGVISRVVPIVHVDEFGSHHGLRRGPIATVAQGAGRAVDDLAGVQRVVGSRAFFRVWCLAMTAGEAFGVRAVPLEQARPRSPTAMVPPSRPDRI